MYGTICDNCQNRSETSSDFLEIEVNFEVNDQNALKGGDLNMFLSTPEQYKARGPNSSVIATREAIWR